MTRFSQLASIAFLAAGSFGLAFIAKGRVSRHGGNQTVAKSLDTAPDSVRLAAMGYRPGRQLVAYVLVSSDCSYCQLPDTKAAIRRIRHLFRRNIASGYRSATVVGVDLDVDVNKGLDYIKDLGVDNFDEISVGQGWLNENLVRLVWRAKAAPASVPEVIVLSREMNPNLTPFKLRFGADSVVGLMTGRQPILRWVGEGATIQSAAATMPAMERERDATPVASGALSR